MYITALLILILLDKVFASITLYKYLECSVIDQLRGCSRDVYHAKTGNYNAYISRHGNQQSPTLNKIVKHHEQTTSFSNRPIVLTTYSLSSHMSFPPPPSPSPSPALHHLQYSPPPPNSLPRPGHNPLDMEMPHDDPIPEQNYLHAQYPTVFTH